MSNSLRRAPRRSVIIIAAVVAVAIAGALIVAAWATVNISSAQPTDSAAPVETTTVERRDLSETEDFPGTLAFGVATPVKGGAGVLTELPVVGTVLDRGSVAFRMNDLPVPVFIGATPLFRPLDAVGLAGNDVLMVATNLSADGFYTGTLPTDPTKAVWTSKLVKATKAWQRAAGLAQTGVISPGDVVVLGAASRVSSVTANLGDSASGTVLSVTGISKAVSVEVSAADAAKLAIGTAVTVILPDGSPAPATVTAIGTVVKDTSDDASGGSANAVPTLTITVAPDSQDSVAGLDYAAVKVRVVTDSRTAVLAVPVEALLALAEGGYALQKADGSLVAVTTGMFDGDVVEVSGAGLTEGMTIVTAS